jgi:hypothetical protein
MATYVFIEDGEMVPITRYGNVEKFIGLMNKVYQEASKGHKTRAKMRLLSALRHTKFGLLRKYLWPILKTGSYESLGELHRKMLLISSMHFMDPYNFDLERVQRCVIHYAVPDGRIIPFCTMNSIHRAKIEEELSIPLNEWRREHKAEISVVA